MDGNKCRALLAALEAGSLSGAAEKLGYTISGMSRMMAALEGEVGLPLLLRGKQGVRPTAECAALLPSLRALVQAQEVCRQEVQALRGLQTGQVRLGTAYAAFYPLLAQVTWAFRQARPGVAVQIRRGYSTALAQALEDFSMDLCLISRRETGGRWVPLFTDPLVAVLPPSHPLAAQERVPLAAFARFPYVETYPDADSDNARALRRAGVVPATCCATMDSAATCTLVQAGLGIALENKCSTAGWTGVALRPVEPAEEIEIGLALSRRPTLAAQAFFTDLEKGLGETFGRKAP